MKHFSKLFIILILLLLPLQSIIAVSNSINVGQQVTGSCNNNGVCEAGLGEDSSNCAADCPATTPLPPGGVVPIFDTTPPIISNLAIKELNSNSAKISWKTNELAVCQLFLGKTREYEKEGISEDSFRLDHSSNLVNLAPESAYYFKIICSDTNKNKVEAENNFITLSLPDISPPDNISHFKAKAGDAEVILTWQNPLDADFHAVKIFRSEKFYPKNPEGGALIYDGEGNSFTDKNLTNGVVYYYTAFAYDFSGNYSSGAIVKAVPQKLGQPTPSPIFKPSPTPQVSPTPEITNLKLEDFNFSQGAGNLKIADGKIEVESGKSLIVSIDSKKVPEAVGTMMFILAQDGEPQSYLFKYDAGKKEYSVSFAPPALGGVYSLTIAVLDKINNPVQAISGDLIVNVAAKSPEKSSWYIDLLWIFLLIFIILVLRTAWKLIKESLAENKRKKEEKINQKKA